METNNKKLTRAKVEELKLPHYCAATTLVLKQLIESGITENEMLALVPVSSISVLHNSLAFHEQEINWDLHSAAYGLNQVLQGRTDEQRV